MASLEFEAPSSIFVAPRAFLKRARPLANSASFGGGKKLAAIQMLDVQFPTTDGRKLILSRYTQPEMDQKLLLAQLGLSLPAQPPPRISAGGELETQASASPDVVETFDRKPRILGLFHHPTPPVEKVGLERFKLICGQAGSTLPVPNFVAIATKFG